MNELEIYMGLPYPNWWNEDMWYGWYSGLKTIIVAVDVSKDFTAKVNEITVNHGHDKHWSHWLMWYDELKEILLDGEKRQ